MLALKLVSASMWHSSPDHPKSKGSLSLTPPRHDWFGSGFYVCHSHRLKAINVPFLPLTTHLEHESAHLFCLFPPSWKLCLSGFLPCPSFQADTRIHQFWIVSFTIPSSSLSIFFRCVSNYYLSHLVYFSPQTLYTVFILEVQFGCLLLFSPRLLKFLYANCSHCFHIFIC